MPFHQRFKFLCHYIGVTATQELTCRLGPILSRHYDSMMQNGLQIAGPLGWGGMSPRQAPCVPSSIIENE